MSTLRKIVVCVNHRANPNLPSCGARGGETIACRLESELRQRALEVTVEHFNCLGQCEAGPNIRLAPAGPFYHGLTESDIPDLMIEIESFFNR
ncbi:MAG TPA: (2Fe-2S) ferredoxin domain-containing protein [Methylophilaceae bacterium]|nr:(2Fe-2S) ferredoxin domain-containing protein [Methylophilaceae bacterium]